MNKKLINISIYRTTHEKMIKIIPKSLTFAEYMEVLIKYHAKALKK